ncbi:unnamed protein product, partial [Prorocentrum cordatum]
AGYPRDVLRGFAKTPRLRPGESEAVVFTLTGRDISYYSVGRGWLTPQYIIARVGESSVDLRQTLKVESVPRVPTSAPTQAPTLAPTSAPTVTTLTTSATTTSATTTTSTSTTRAPGWYGSLVGHGCDEECSSLGLSCTEEGLWSNRADVNTSKKVLALVAALGGNTSAVACADETDESYAGTSSPSWGPHSCSRVRQDRELGTFDCSAPPRRGEARLCYCGEAAPFRITLGDVGRVARETWNRSHIGEQLGSWEQQLGSWGHDHGLDSVIRPVMDLQPASRDTEAAEKRELSRSVRSGDGAGARSGCSWRRLAWRRRPSSCSRPGAPATGTRAARAPRRSSCRWSSSRTTPVTHQTVRQTVQTEEDMLPPRRRSPRGASS